MFEISGFQNVTTKTQTKTKKQTKKIPEDYKIKIGKYLNVLKYCISYLITAQ